MNQRAVWALIALVVFATRLCHLNIVWVEEGYPTAAAIQMFAGKTIYKDFWFDKPPLFPAVYLLWGARTGLAYGPALLARCCRGHTRVAESKRMGFLPRRSRWP